MSDGHEPTEAAHTPPAPHAADPSQTPQDLTGEPTPHEAEGTGAAREAEPPHVTAAAEMPHGTQAPRGETAPGLATADVAGGARVVRQVVCGYRLGWLGSDWLQAWRRLVRLLAASDLDVTAVLAPLEALPADTHILIVSPDLREAARQAAPPNTPILVTPASAAAGAFADLVSRLEAGSEFTAARAPSPGAAVA